MDKDRKKILDRRAKGRAEALGKDKGKLKPVFLDLQDPVILVRGTVRHRILPFSHKVFDRNEIILAK